MYTVILYVGSETDTDYYRLWVQDFENANLGKVISTPLLNTEESVGSVIQAVKGIETWNLILVLSKLYQTKVNKFLNMLKGSVCKKSFLLYMPGRTWIVLKRFRNADKMLYQRKIDMTFLPAYCRLVECIVDTEAEQWKEHMKFICIITLLAVNQMPLEDFTVYQRHLIDVDLDMEEYWACVKQYKKNLQTGIWLAGRAVNRISQKNMESSMEAVLNVPMAKWEKRHMISYKYKYEGEAGKRNKAYQEMKFTLKRELEEVKKDVAEKEQNFCSEEKELSDKDLQRIMEKKKEEEEEIVSIRINLWKEEAVLDEKRNMAERKILSEEMIRWDLKDIIFMGIKGFFVTFIVGVIEPVKIVNIINMQIKGKVFLGVNASLACVAAIFVMLLLGAQNLYQKFVKRYYLKKVSMEMNEFNRNSRNGFNRFAKLCCSIMMRQTLARKHKLEVKHKRKRVEGAQRHYEFCLHRLMELEEWENFFCNQVVDDMEKMDREGTRKIDITREPELEPMYRMFDAERKVDLLINRCEKSLYNPFPFVKGITIERDFEHV